MSRIELATRLDKVMLQVVPFDYGDNDYNVGYALNDIINNPEHIISDLIDIIEMLTD